MSVYRPAFLLFFASLMLGATLARAEDLEAGKSGPKLFSSNCSMCHTSPRTLAKRMDSWSLTDFLGKHYTASQTSANELAVYLLTISSHSPREKQGSVANGSPKFMATPTAPPRPPGSVPTQ